MTLTCGSTRWDFSQQVEAWRFTWAPAGRSGSASWAGDGGGRVEGQVGSGSSTQGCMLARGRVSAAGPPRSWPDASKRVQHSTVYNPLSLAVYPSWGRGWTAGHSPKLEYLLRGELRILKRLWVAIFDLSELFCPHLILKYPEVF